MPLPPNAPSHPLATLARQRFVQGLCGGIPQLDKSLQEFLNALIAQTGTTREMQDRRDTWQRYRDQRQAWARAVVGAWQKALNPPAATVAQAPAGGLELALALVDDDVVENKIVASRLALTVMDAVGSVFDPVRQRTQQLEGQELSSQDILRPEACCQLLVEQWVEAKLPRADLQTLIDPLQRALAELLQSQYQALNTLYDERGVVVQTDLRARVRRAASPSGAGPSTGGSMAGGLETGQGDMGGATGMTAQALAHAGAAPHLRHLAHAPPGYAPQGPGMPMAGMGMGAAPLVRARQRAQSVMTQLRRLLVQPATGYDMAQAPPATQALTQALAAQRVQASTFYSSLGAMAPDAGPVAVVQLVGQVREQSTELKKKAATASEKAIIEVVALMFQSILTEDRIPSAVRVWFARLQVPVLRVALAEPEFFSNLDHPARRLIDRMGACVMGFDASSINGNALEAEVRRIVQVIEQYPETGRRVFQLVYDEFEKFLAKFLTEGQATAKLVSVAQQVEQRETLAIQYTIELRTLLKDMPVRDEIREFLFKTWAEVLALSAVRDGAQHADTLAYKHTAADLVWAASAKPHRSDRAQVIQSLPGLLQRLRQGLALLGVEGDAQDAQVKALTDTLAEAFLAKTAAIPQAHIDAMAKRLANLEDFIGDATLGDMPLSSDNIEMMLGIDASAIQVIADTGAPVQEDMVAWAQELPLGTWYQLDHNGASAQVQYAWRSERRQLHLFAAIDGSCYLIQLRRLGAYLQAGLLVPQDEEGLTVRATRDALAKIDANPERLLN